MLSFLIAWSWAWFGIIAQLWSIYETRMHSTSREALNSSAIAGPVEYSIAGGVFVSRRLPSLIFGKRIFSLQSIAATIFITMLIYAIIYLPPYLARDRNGAENLLPLITNGVTYHWYNVDRVPFYLMSHERFSAVATSVERSVSTWAIVWIAAGLTFDYLMLCKSRALMNRVKIMDTSLRAAAFFSADVVSTFILTIVFWSLTIAVGQTIFLLYYSQPGLFHFSTRVLYMEKAFPTVAANDFHVVLGLLSTQISHPTK